MTINNIRKQGAKDIMKAVTTPFDDLRALEVRHDAMERLLGEIIQILDYSHTKEVQDTGNAIGLIRSKVDNLLNKEN